ncbi:MAG: PQQ-binding-like beta-propeller repeat protein, partial [Actinomycetota bacterium]|nr:PQQ-binding-like beta-propeller repeat protein [Actinomycetota bacterium]
MNGIQTAVRRVLPLLAALVLVLGLVAVADAQVSEPARVKWRFQLDGDYSLHQAGMAADGTVYVSMINGKLYAMNPDGTQKWLVQLGLEGAVGPVVVGSDGTIYVAASVTTAEGTSAGAIFALNPDGTQKWVFDDTRAFIIAGPGIGPDGNIYAVTDLAAGGDQLGLFSLTPAGVLRFSVGSFSDVGPTGEEIAFGADQLHFALGGSLFAYDLSGNLRWSVDIGGESPQRQGAVGPNGNVVIGTGPNPTNLTAFTPSGSQAWTFYEFPGNTLTYPDVGPDDVSYVVRNLSTLHAFNPDGTEKWRHVDPNILFEPVVSGDNDLIFMGGRITYGQPGLFLGVSNAGDPLWQVNLPDEPGFEPYGQLVPISRPAFSPDGDTAYTVVDVAGDGGSANPYSFLYAIDTSGAAPPTTFTLSVAKAGSGSGTVTSSPAGINCGSDCSEAYASGTSVTLTARASRGSTFTGWSGACTGTGSCVVSMTVARSVTATFNTSGGSTFTLTVTKAGTGSGTVTSSPA